MEAVADGDKVLAGSLHKCKYCGEVSDLNSRCDKATTHKHTCSLCNAVGTNTNTAHKYTGYYNRNWESSQKHSYVQKCSCGEKTPKKYHSLNTYSQGNKTVFFCRICGYNITL